MMSLETFTLLKKIRLNSSPELELYSTVFETATVLRTQKPASYTMAMLKQTAVKGYYD